MKFIGAEEEVKAHGFTNKVPSSSSFSCVAAMNEKKCVQPGGAAKLNQYKREGCKFQHTIYFGLMFRYKYCIVVADSDFIETDPDSGAFQVVSLYPYTPKKWSWWPNFIPSSPKVKRQLMSILHIVSQIRSEFDDILLRHAEKCGAKVIQETQVTDIHFSPKDPTQPISASYVRKSKSVDGHSGEVDGGQGEIKFDYLIDASGRRGIMSTRYLKNRKFNQTLKNIAVWGYWTGVKKYMAGTAREGAIWVEALTGW